MTTLNRLIEDVYLIFGIHDLSQTVKLVTLLFLVFFIAIVFLFLITLGTLIVHKVEQSRRKKYHALYMNQILAVMVDPSAQEPSPPRKHIKYFRNVIIDLIFVTKGFEKSILFELYKKWGLWDKDLKRISHFLWHKRLAALVRLDLWEESIGYEKLKKPLHDPVIKIRQIAIKNLSRTNKEEEAELLINMLISEKVYHSTLYESIHRMLQIHPDVVMSALNDEKFKKLWPQIFKAIGNLRMLSAVPRLTIFLEESFMKPIPEDALEKAVSALGKIGDPRPLPILEKIMGSNSAVVRLAALRSIVNIDRDVFHKFHRELSNDPDPLIRNWTLFYAGGGHD